MYIYLYSVERIYQIYGILLSRIYTDPTVTFLNLNVMVLNVDEISCNFKFFLLISSYIHLKKNFAK